MNRVIIAILLVSIIIINLPLFKNQKVVYIPKPEVKIPSVVLKKPLEFPMNHPRVNIYRSQKSSFDYI